MLYEITIKVTGYLPVIRTAEKGMKKGESRLHKIQEE